MLSRRQLNQKLLSQEIEINSLTKVVAHMYRILAVLEYNRSSTGWAYVPTQNYTRKDGVIESSVGHAALAAPSVPLSMLVSRVMRWVQL